MKSLRFFLLLGLLAGSWAVIPSASAIVLPLDGKWLVLDEVSDGNGGYRFGSTVTIRSEHAIELCLADLYVPGEMYEVIANGTTLGATGDFNRLLSGDWTADPEEAKKLESFSYGCWLLDPGEYTLQLITVQRPDGEAYRNTAGTLALSAREIPRPVPEGGSSAILLMGSLLGLVAGSRLPRGRK